MAFKLSYRVKSIRHRIVRVRLLLRHPHELVHRADRPGHVFSWLVNQLLKDLQMLIYRYENY